MPSSARVSAGLHRAVLAEHLQLVLGRARIGMVLDAGAHDGSYGRLLRGLGYTGLMVSFEPASGSFETLATRAAADPRWSIHRLALGAIDGEAELAVAASSDLSSLLRPSAYGREVAGAAIAPIRHERVELRRLDGLRRQLGLDPDDVEVLLKVDVQGMELELLKGAGDWILDIAAVQVEVPVQRVYDGSPAAKDVFAVMRRAGLELTSVVPVTRDHLLRVVALDCVFVRPECVTNYVGAAI